MIVKVDRWLLITRYDRTALGARFISRLRHNPRHSSRAPNALTSSLHSLKHVMEACQGAPGIKTRNLTASCSFPPFLIMVMRTSANPPITKNERGQWPTISRVALKSRRREVTLRIIFPLVNTIVQFLLNSTFPHIPSTVQVHLFSFFFPTPR